MGPKRNLARQLEILDRSLDKQERSPYFECWGYYGRFCPSIDLVCSTSFAAGPMHRFSRVSFVGKTAGNPKLEKLTIEFFHHC